jgi:hypothetical protein
VYFANKDEYTTLKPAEITGFSFLNIERRKMEEMNQFRI